MLAMETMKKMRGSRRGVIQCELTYPGDRGALDFSRADLVFYGVDHSLMSYDVKAFFNNKSAGPETPRQREEGYAGRIITFGHGGCFGEAGHCDVRITTGDVYDRRPSHALVPQTKIITVTEALRRIINQGDALELLTLVPYVRTPRRRDRYCGDGIFDFKGLRLITYI